MRIEEAESGEAMEAVRQLFREYAESLEVDLCFQGFEGELRGLPGGYARPEGRLLVAYEGEQAMACAALRRMDANVCEMKRLYVRPAHRGKGIGVKLILELTRAAREIGYQQLRLDTLPSMQKAIALYRSMGFQQIPPYRTNPVPGALYFELDLR